MIRRIDVAIDCHDPDSQAKFWAEVLGYRRFGSTGQYRSIVPDAVGDGPKIILQGVPEAKSVKNRLHLDLVVDDVGAEVARIENLGATQVQGAAVEEADVHWILMADPEGNEFCICSN